MTVSFKIPYPKTSKGKSRWSKSYGLNAYYSGKHWSVRKKDAEYWHSLVRHEMERQGVKKILLQNPVVISMYFNDRLDCINHAAMFKMIEDGLKGWIITDDSRRYVKGSEIYFHDEDYIRVVISE